MPDFAAARLRAPSRRSRFASIPIALIARAAVAPVAQAGTSPWRDLEDTYLEMLNCTRTGGRILDDGTCEGRGAADSWHWKNIKNRHVKEVGIGIWRVEDRTYLVTDYVSA
ncbi:MAG: hypothetical protein ABIZ34_02905 [Candidatus Limnocylindrales bacterium]